MVTTTMKTIRLIVLLLAAITIASASAAQTASKPPKNAKPAAAVTQTNQTALTNQTVFCCRHANRVFGDNTTVNLTPLFQWWKSHAPANGSADSDTTAAADSSRPLSAWCRITGTKIGFAGSGYDWLVDAVVYTSPTAHTAEHIILKNPPTTEEQSFNNLKKAIAVDSLQITNDLQTYKAETAAAQKATAKKSAAKKGKRSNNNGNAQQAAQQDRDAAAAALENQKQLEAQLALAQKQFDAIPAVKGKYQIDWFAVEAGKDNKGVPIYDVGVVDPHSP